MILMTSPSSRRTMLLQQMGFKPRRDFIQIDMPINPDWSQKMEISEAREKTIFYSKLKVQRAIEERRALVTENLDPDTTVVVTMTTVAFFDGYVLGRPLSTSGKSGRILDPTTRQLAEKEATNMLKRLSGKEFQVITGIVTARSTDNQMSHVNTRWVETRAWMKNYSDEEIARYVRTGEPLDKAGGFGIQERGAVLFSKIEGSYSNIVGLPVVEFYDMLHLPEYAGCVEFHLSEAVDREPDDPHDQNQQREPKPTLQVVSMGDINYDFHCSTFPEGYFALITPPGEHLQEKIHRSVGGTGVNFARHAVKAGFSPCSVLGVIAGDGLGRDIEHELNAIYGIRTLLPMDYRKKTSIAILLRDQGKPDTLVSLIDSDQSLREEDVEKAIPAIRDADVFFVTGYCLNPKDKNRLKATLKAIDIAIEEDALVVLDVPVNMENEVEDFEDFRKWVRGKAHVLVIESKTLLNWLFGQYEIEEHNWEEIEKIWREKLQADFPVMFVRDSHYQQEVIFSPGGVSKPLPLDYYRLTAEEKIGYGDFVTANRLAHFLSPRVLLASASPRRLALLQQIIAPNKIQVTESGNSERKIESEMPEERVCRLASEKARLAWERFQHERQNKGETAMDEVRDIQVVIGADTEIVLNGREVGHPETPEETRKVLQSLSGKEHTALTGLALFETATGKERVVLERTKVKFKELLDDEIEDYIASREPFGKAGGYGIQGKGGLFIEKINGSYSNVVGLPLEILSDELTRLGMPIWDMDRVSNWKLLREEIKFKEASKKENA